MRPDPRPVLVLSAAFVLLALLRPLAPLDAAADEPAPLFTAQSLPTGWRITKVISVPSGALPALGRRLGGSVAALTNQILDLNGFPGQLNAIRAADASSATAIYRVMVDLRGEDYVARRGLYVYEVPGTNLLVARRIRHALGIPAATHARYEVHLVLALVDEVVDSERNAVFNQVLALRKQPGSAVLESGIRQAVKDWTFGRTLRVQTPRPPLDRATWTFDPSPLSVEEDGRETRYLFGDVPTFAGIPAVTARVEMEVGARFEPTAGGVDETLVAPTTRWPAAPVSAFAAEAVSGADGPTERVLALLHALFGRIRQGGRTGSRDPVGAVFARGYGRCFDRTDVFVAAARSVGVPARAIAGWVPALGAGHVWAEVFLEGRGWVPVDATTPWLGTGIDYLPLFQTEAGPLPFLHLAWPEIRRTP